MNNPYTILGVSPDSSLLNIKRKYKELAFKMHPDKGGSATLFKLLQLSYAKILEEHKLKNIDKAFNELKVDFEDFKEKQDRLPSTNTYKNKTNESFLEKFNKTFDDNKQESPYDKGYGDKMTQNGGVREDINVKRSINKFTLDSFNKAFDEHDTRNVKHLIKKTIPTPHSISKQLTYTELGVNDIKDFSGENKNKKDLHYTDYHVAYTTTKLIDPTMVRQQKQFKNIKELERDRHNDPLRMSSDEFMKYQRALKKQEMKESKRVKILETHDNNAQDHFNKVNQLMMDYRKH